MTKVIKVWKRMSFWNKIRGFLTVVGFGSQLGAYLAEISQPVKIAVGLAAVAAFLITYLFTDEDADGVVDWFQKATRRKPNTKQ
jgi:hypothetical protein